MASGTLKLADWSVAKKGLTLFLNNKPEESNILFASRSDSFHIKAAQCYISFMNALMTFEDNQLQQATKLLKDTGRDCESDINWLKCMTNKLLGSDPKINDDYGMKLERQIVAADTQLCAAILVLVQQVEISNYVRVGWMMRKAWRIYQQTYFQILHLYRRTFGINPSGFNEKYAINECHLNWSTNSSSNGSGGSLTPSAISSTPKLPLSSTSALKNSLSMIFSFSNISTTDQQNIKEFNFVEPAQVIRLMSAVSFGYGIFQLCTSLVPPSLLKLIHFLGFEGNRRIGLTALMYARLGEDMRAPLATLALLCYHTIIRPFCSPHDCKNIKAGINAAKQLISECQEEYPSSSLFLFFTGQIEKLQSNIDAALEAHDKAMKVSSSQREIQLLCLHEIAWCHVIKLNYAGAHNAFERLQNESRWCKSLHVYLAAVCAGANGNYDDIHKIHTKIQAMMINTTKSMTQLDIFVSRRVSKLINYNGNAYPAAYYKMLVYEYLYLWHTMSSCSVESLCNIISECTNNRDDEPMVGLSYLIAGAAYLYLNKNSTAIKCFRSCLKYRIPTNDIEDQHISSFALYELGVSLCNSNRVEEGKITLIKAQSQYTNYDFESRLNMRIQSALKSYL
ncbi:hypothetical protein PV325_007157 [Microctonus aethiopoides]|uniref:Tetratricopeptide repeat protein 39C n=1 Tax=Microctonus aethiopoides TaxID=144406 RepID=A0AA39FII6_9HYME|nr:hypothetical protein PV325_007157 [Microctonus aethiopoides]KAK0170090.1 hypothetical protein PV328_010695 [Microctonus aethiopoides]